MVPLVKHVHRLMVIDRATAKNCISPVRTKWGGCALLHTIPIHSPKPQQLTSHPNSCSQLYLVCVPISLLQQWYRLQSPGLSTHLRSAGHGLGCPGQKWVAPSSCRDLAARWESTTPLFRGGPARLAFWICWWEWTSRLAINAGKTWGFPKAKRANKDFKR